MQLTEQQITTAIANDRSIEYYAFGQWIKVSNNYVSRAIAAKTAILGSLRIV